MSNFKKYRNKETGEIVEAREDKKIISLHMSGEPGYIKIFILKDGKEFSEIKFKVKFEEVTNES